MVSAALRQRGAVQDFAALGQQRQAIGAPTVHEGGGEEGVRRRCGLGGAGREPGEEGRASASDEVAAVDQRRPHQSPSSEEKPAVKPRAPVR